MKKSSFSKFLEEKGFAIFMILLVTTIFVIYAIVCLLIGGKKNIQNNWAKHRENPLVMPFGDFLAPKPVGKAKQVTGMENFNKIMFKNTEGFAKIFTQPLLFMIKGIHTNLNSFRDALDNIRKMGYKIRVFFLRTTKDIMDRLQNVGATLMYFFAKLKAIFEKLYAVFVGMVYMVYSAYMTLQSMWNGPIGGVARFLCFDKDTQIILNTNEIKSISKIKIGDKIKDGGIVKGVLACSSKGIEMYSYKGIIVSGDHLVKENHIWIRVCDSYESKKINYNENILYCLVTENNIINIDNIIFADYIETSDVFIQEIVKEKILKNLNKNICAKKNSKETKENNYLIGFNEDTLIKMNDGYSKEIKNICIGDITSTGKVLGLIVQKTNGNITKYKNTILSENNLYFSENGWIKIGDISKESYVSDQYLYHLVTDTGFIKLADNSVFTDFTETLCVNTNESIDTEISNYLNKKILIENIILYEIIKNSHKYDIREELII